MIIIIGLSRVINAKYLEINLNDDIVTLKTALQKLQSFMFYATVVSSRIKKKTLSCRLLKVVNVKFPFGKCFMTCSLSSFP